MNSFQGKVSRVVETNCMFGANQDTLRETIVAEYLYDCHGRKIEEYHPRRAYVNRITYCYNKRGRLVEKTEYLDDNTVLFLHRYKYNKRGQIIEYNKVNSNEMVYEHHRNTFDENGMLTMRFVKDLEHQEEYRFQYDEDGRIVEKQFLLNDAMFGAKRYSYLPSGPLSSLHFEDTKGNEIAIHHSYQQYQERGYRVERETITDGNNAMQGCYTSHYDNKGRLIYRLQQYPDGHSICRYIMYDDESNVVNTHWFNTRNRLFGIDTDYMDSNGHLVRQLCTTGKLSLIEQTLKSEYSIMATHTIEYKKEHYIYTYFWFRRKLCHGGYRDTHIYFTPQGRVHSRVFRTYDESGHLLEEIDGNHRDSYSYDECGNLVCHTRHENDHCISEVRYNIEYQNK